MIQEIILSKRGHEYYVRQTKSIFGIQYYTYMTDGDGDRIECSTRKQAKNLIKYGTRFPTKLDYQRVKELNK